MLFACLILMQRSFVIDAFNANLPNQGKLNGGITLKKELVQFNKRQWLDNLFTVVY